MSNIKQEFKELDSRWVAAYLQGDIGSFDHIWIDGFIFTSPFGRFTNKAQEIADIKSGNLVIKSLRTDNVKVKVYGDTAVMAGRFMMKGRYKALDIGGQYSYTDVLRKQHEYWQIVASHASRIA